MKKLYSVLTAIVLILNVSACAHANKEAFFREDILNGLDTTIHTWSDKAYHYAALVIQNNSSCDRNLSANVIFKNDEGKTIGAESDSLYVFERGTEGYLVFSNEEPFATVDYTYTPSELDFYKPLSSNVSCDVSKMPNKIITTFKNNGTEKIYKGNFQVLFMTNGAANGYAFGSFNDIAPATADAHEIWYDSSLYDDVKIYYSAYSLDR